MYDSLTSVINNWNIRYGISVSSVSPYTSPNSLPHMKYASKCLRFIFSEWKLLHVLLKIEGGLYFQSKLRVKLNERLFVSLFHLALAAKRWLIPCIFNIPRHSIWLLASFPFWLLMWICKVLCPVQNLWMGHIIVSFKQMGNLYNRRHKKTKMYLGVTKE